MSRNLKQLQELHPLASQWTPAESFVQHLQVDNFRVELTGLCTYHQEGAVITATAARVGEVPLERAYFQLLERTSVVEAELSLSTTYTSDELGAIPSIKVFPLSPDPDQWQYASASGVAAAISREDACAMAWTDLIKRDRILRSWFGEISPVEIKLPADFLPAALSQRYEFSAHQFPEPKWDPTSIKAVAIYGYPKAAGIPRICGFGGGLILEKALDQAKEDCFQSIGYLWGEPIPQTAPPFSPTADYHREVFLRSPGIDRIRKWLKGDHRSFAQVRAPSIPEKVFFVDITPKALKPGLSVMKAISNLRVPLTFGASRLNAPANFPDELLVHPLV